MTNVYVKDWSLYAAIREAASRRVRIGIDFPADIRAVGSDKLVWVSWDDWTRELFFRFVSELSRSLHATWWGVLVTDPDPEKYFHHHFACYPAILGNELSSHREYLAAIAADPGGNPADAISLNSDTVLLADSSGRWAGYFNRDFGLGVLVTHGTELPAYPYDAFPDPISAASNLLPDEGAHLKSNSAFSQLVSSYSASTAR